MAIGRSLSVFDKLWTKDNLALLQEICPFNDFCTPKALMNITDEYVSCCQECSCTDRCHIAGNCCPDANTAHLMVTHSPPCHTTQHFYNDTYEGLSKPAFGYRIIQSCPNSTLTSSTYNGCTKPRTLEDMSLVSDGANTAVYANIHCARCNGVSTVIPWRMYARNCSQYINTSFKTFEERNEVVTKNCILVATPPSSEIGRKSKCLLENKAYGSQPNDLCLRNEVCGLNTRHMFVRQEIKSHKSQALYRNPLCFNCVKTTDFLGTGPVSSGMCKPGLPGKSRDFPLTTLLDLRLPEQGDGNLPCRSFQIYDTYLYRCEDLICPQGQIPFNGKCFKTFENAKFFNIEFYTTLSTPVTIVSLIQSLHGRAQAQMAYEINKPPSMMCVVCRSEMFKDSAANKFMAFTVQPDDACPLSRLQDILTQLSTKPTTFEFDWYGNIFNVSMRVIEPNFTGIHLSTTANRQCRSGAGIETVRFVHKSSKLCPKIAMSEAILLGTGVNRSTVETYSHGRDEHGALLVCLETYLDIMHQASANNHGLATSVVNNLYTNIWLAFASIIYVQTFS